MNKPIEIIKDADLPEVEVREVVEIDPKARYIIVVKDNMPNNFIFDLRDKFAKFLDSDSRFFIILGNIKFVKVIDGDNED